MGLFDRSRKSDQERLERSLDKSRSSFFGKLNRLVRGRDRVDESVLDELEELLVTSDVGIQTTLYIVDKVQKRVAKDRYVSTGELQGLIRDEIARLLHESDSQRPAGFRNCLARKTVRNHGCRRKWRGEDDDHRQVGQQLSPSRSKRLDWRSRHVSCRSH